MGMLRQVRGSLLKAASLYVVDVLITGGILAGLMIVAVVLLSPVMLVSMLFSFRDRALTKQDGVEVVIYSAMILAIVSTVALNNHIARQRANDLIAACHQYHAKYEKFPDKLDELVPEFVSEIPRAKPTLASNRFHYVAGPDLHALMYVVIPPFDRAHYILEEGRWGHMD